MQTDKTLNETKEKLAELGYSEVAPNAFANKEGEIIEAEGKWVKKEGYGTWRNTQDDDFKY